MCYNIAMFGYKKYAISAQSLFKICLFFGLTVLVVILRDYLLIILAAMIVAMVLRPLIAWLDQKGVIRSLATIGIFVLIILFLMTWLVVFTPLLESQIKEIINNLPKFLDQINYWLGFFRQQIGLNLGNADFADTAINFLQNTTWSINSIFILIFSNFLKLIIFFITVFYLIWDKKVWDRLELLSGYHGQTIKLLIVRVEDRLSRWALGQTILCFVIFLLTFIALKSLGIKYSLLLALLAGLLEVIPYLGPITTGLVVGLFTLANESTKFFWVLLVLYIIQVTENNLLVPQIMSKVVGVNALSVVLFLLAASKIFGLLGTFLAVPMLVVVKNSWLLWQERQSKEFQKYASL